MFRAARFGILALTLCAALPAAAQEAYPAARLDRAALVPVPPAIARFAATLRALHAEGAFAAGGGTQARDDLDGMGAKAWLLAHVSEDFRCLSDFGGTCPEVSGPQAHVARFLARFGRFGDGAPDFAAIARDGPGDPGPLAFDLAILMQDQDWLSPEEGMLCTAQARSDEMDAVEAALTERTGGDLLQALDGLRALVGRYNIRAEAAIGAEVLARVEDAILYFPAPHEITEEPREDGPPYRWRAVLLPDGRQGFVAPQPSDLLDAGGLGEQVCFDAGADPARIVVHVGGGD